MADADAALAHIHLFSSARNPALPLCLLDIGEGLRRERSTIVNGRAFESEGQLVAYFRDAVPADLVDSDAVFRFTNHLGAVWADLESQAGRQGAVGITDITLSVPPTRIEPDRRQHAGDLFEAALSCGFRLTP